MLAEPLKKAGRDLVFRSPQLQNPMSTIMTRFRLRQQPIPTGLSTASVAFETLPNVAVALQCPLCGMVHYWRPQDAWVQEEPQRDRPHDTCILHHQFRAQNRGLLIDAFDRLPRRKTAVSRPYCS